MGTSNVYDVYILAKSTKQTFKYKQAEEFNPKCENVFEQYYIKEVYDLDDLYFNL